MSEGVRELGERRDGCKCIYTLILISGTTGYVRNALYKGVAAFV